METLAPPKEQLSKFDYEKPEYNQKVLRLAYRKRAPWEKIKVLEPEHRQAFRRLERHWYGAQGYDVRFDDEDNDVGSFVPPEDRDFAIFYHGGELESSKKAVNNPRAWKALIGQIDPDQAKTPEEIGREWFGKKARDSAKCWGEATIVAGLDPLCIYYKLISKPPD